ncbi:MAG: 2-oxoacid:acceptor oxidoreductase subunit alpha [Candidatus Omnitrophica bacterium]|nr:2-oxoacid:acceptor oxidoreductase subunit alpha [Candidatus Omnitrophota bacterium]
MIDFSILIGGKAGFGIDKSGSIIGRLLNQLGYRVFIYRDYPSIIRGGHTFSIIRAHESKIAAYQDKVDFVIALNQETLDLHKSRLKKECFYIFDSDQLKLDAGQACGIGAPLGKILKEENAPEIMRNSCIIGALAKAIGIDFGILENVLKKEFSKEVELNIKVARRGFDEAKELIKIESLKQEILPLVSGNEAVALGLIKGGLSAFIAYPMTPTSPVLHYLAEVADNFLLDVIHPESEISVILMALGFSYIGRKVAVGTSGGGFCLMTEGLSFAAMAELPVVIILGQRPGPSTGLPTYSAQTELSFALSAGQGEFTRFIAAPGDAEEAYYWSAVSMNVSWKYQIPSIILTDKNLGESVSNFDINSVDEIKEEKPILWDGKSPYKRYAFTENGVSPLAFVPAKDAIVKINSYEHDESGITTEDPELSRLMQEKRLRKKEFLIEDLEALGLVKVYGNKDAQVSLVCWGSNKGVCIEVAQKMGLRLIQPLVIEPFPIKQFNAALSGVNKIILVECNATAQLAGLLKGYGINADSLILKYDGRPFSLEELEKKISEVLIWVR